MNFFSRMLKHIARNENLISTFNQDPMAYEALLKPAKRYIVEHESEAIKLASRYEAKGYAMSLEYMGGEDSKTRELCEINTLQFVHLASRCERLTPGTNLCLDLSTIGLVLDRDFALENLEKICCAAQKTQCNVIISMEEFHKVDDILFVYYALSEKYDNLGITLQAYLHRTQDDLTEPRFARGIVRLVKGVYSVSERIAIQEKAHIREKYLEYLTQLAKQEVPVLVASCDEALIEAILGNKQLSKASITFEMLHGVRPELLKQIKDRGYQTRIYLCYGKEWYTHFFNRLSEKPENVIQAITDLQNEQTVVHPY
ncbi:Proline dehydrogenase family protein [Vibrio crassostreae]|uniref:proline dehydrogenase family protein n=1 Tax=Vibrio sp. L5-1 TaxID=2912254 RepID=UPI001F27708E|nr:proline dehydrogenase family protein [Vibrio sp. L5-1]CAK3055657.1 Proline dehydrogenase family protein [Vibrio crassostreae]CAK3061143.1 Proline dehydrogenase family protein [Vibrio crassostreae]CAK3070029.1 Proline dehydrogenase family protein [Vibrio crassostreae]CAK3072062.1 Proline dehydrogenase family protein [Vibrio crassostreae]